MTRINQIRAEAAKNVAKNSADPRVRAWAETLHRIYSLRPAQASERRDHTDPGG